MKSFSLVMEGLNTAMQNKAQNSDSFAFRKQLGHVLGLDYIVFYWSVLTGCEQHGAAAQQQHSVTFCLNFYRIHGSYFFLSLILRGTAD